MSATHGTDYFLESKFFLSHQLSFLFFLCMAQNMLSQDFHPSA